MNGIRLRQPRAKNNDALPKKPLESRLEKCTRTEKQEYKNPRIYKIITKTKDSRTYFISLHYAVTFLEVRRQCNQTMAAEHEVRVGNAQSRRAEFKRRAC